MTESTDTDMTVEEAAQEIVVEEVRWCFGDTEIIEDALLMKDPHEESAWIFTDNWCKVER